MSTISTPAKIGRALYGFGETFFQAYQYRNNPNSFNDKQQEGLILKVEGVASTVISTAIIASAPFNPLSLVAGGFGIITGLNGVLIGQNKIDIHSNEDAERKKEKDDANFDKSIDRQHAKEYAKTKLQNGWTTIKSTCSRNKEKKKKYQDQIDDRNKQLENGIVEREIKKEANREAGYLKNIFFEDQYTALINNYFPKFAASAISMGNDMFTEDEYDMVESDNARNEKRRKDTQSLLEKSAKNRERVRNKLGLNKSD